MLNFLFARHRRTYISIGIKFKKNPERVYNLAHGAKPIDDTEKQIMHELLAQGIIHRLSNN